MIRATIDREPRACEFGTEYFGSSLLFSFFLIEKRNFTDVAVFCLAQREKTKSLF